MISDTSFPVRLYIADVSVLSDENAYKQVYSLISDERKTKTDRICFAEGRRRSLGAELLIRVGLAEFGCAGKLRFGYEDHNKPYLQDYPNIQLNISHSGNYVICAFSPSAVGCDVERMRNVDFAVARRYFLEGEYTSILARNTPETQMRQFFRLWTMKESFMKATGLGLSLGLKSFEIIPDGDDIRVRQSVDTNQWHFFEYAFDANYACTVCSLHPQFEKNVRLVDIAKAVEQLASLDKNRTHSI